jgi:hypothetical protein
MERLGLSIIIMKIHHVMLFSPRDHKNHVNIMKKDDESLPFSYHNSQFFQEWEL